jgi:isoquinoline 1-oxidoreductase subunit beta
MTSTTSFRGSTSGPETHVYLVENDHPPDGAGEPATPPTYNAIHVATGKRIRALPVDPQPLKA